MNPESIRQSVCPHCGAVLTADAPLGLCLKCLAQTGAAEDGPGEKTSVLETPDARSPDTRRCATPVASARHLGDYELLEEIARGGMGIVYKASQKSLNRLVAVKMILAGQFASREHVMRFRAEAEAAANLRHPNIVAIHETGEDQGQHFFSMEYVEGRDLGEVVRGSPLSAKRAAGYVEKIAEAIHYAHDQGILHRDLKPSNILIDRADEPRITDFGLAKRMQRDSFLTVTGQVLGSPNFMPPEQAGSGRGKIGPHSDVYALGGVLYFLLTGRPPFSADSVADTLQHVLHTEAISPRLVNPSVPRDLSTICLKCLEKAPATRYQNARTVADELRRFVNGEPIQARPIGQLEKAWRWCRRKPAIASLAAASAVLLLAVAIGSPIAAFQINRERQRAERNAQGEARERFKAEQNLYAADMLLAQQALDDHNRGHAIELLNRHHPEQKSQIRNPKSEADLRGWEWRYLWRLCRSDELFNLGTHSNSVTAVAFSPDSKTLATVGLDAVLKLWDLQTRREIAHRFHAKSITAVAFSRDGQWLATGGEDATVWLWDATTLLKSGGPLTHPADVQALAFSPDSKTLTTVSAGRLKLWDLESRTQRPGPGITGAKCLVYSPDDRTLVIGHADGKLTLWDTSMWTQRRSALIGHPVHSVQDEGVTSLAIAPDGRTLASASWPERRDDLIVKVWDIGTGSQIGSLTNHAALVRSLAFSPNGRILATASSDQSIKLWNVESKSEMTTLNGHADGVWAVAISPDGRWIASGSKDGAVKIWSASPQPDQPAFKRFSSDAYPQLSPDGKTLITWQTNDTYVLCDTPTLRQTAAFAIAGSVPGGPHDASARGGWRANYRSKFPFQSQTGVFTVAVSSGGSLVALGKLSGKITLWDPAIPRELGDCNGHTAAVWPMTFSPDGTTLASTSEDGTIRLWDVRTRREMRRFDGGQHEAIRLAFSADGRLLAVGNADSTAEVWDVTRCRSAALFIGHKSGVSGVAISPDGRLVATASWDGMTKLWEIKTEREVVRLPKARQNYSSIAFSPDGRRLAVGSEGPIRILDTVTGQEVAALKGHETAFAMAFLPDGNTLVSANPEELFVWRAATMAEIETGHTTVAEEDRR